MINITKKNFIQMKNHAIQETPNECCGLLIDKSNSSIVFPCRNMADDKLNNFSINIKDYIKGSEMGNIKAFYHSHCSEAHINDFTLLDKLNSINHKLPMILYFLPNNEFKLFNENSINNEYIGKSFKYNESDCLSLVEKFYLQEFNIILPKEFRNDNWIKESPNRIIDNIQKFQFHEVNDLRFGDIILIKNHTLYPSHLMIYLNNNQILHHRFQGYSTVETYSNFYKNQTNKYLRHNSQ